MTVIKIHRYWGDCYKTVKPFRLRNSHIKPQYKQLTPEVEQRLSEEFKLKQNPLRRIISKISKLIIRK